MMCDSRPCATVPRLSGRSLGIGASSPPTGDAGACSPIGRASLRMAALLRRAARRELRLLVLFLFERPVRDAAGIAAATLAVVGATGDVDVFTRPFGLLLHRRIVRRAERARLLGIGSRLFRHVVVLP